MERIVRPQSLASARALSRRAGALPVLYPDATMARTIRQRSMATLDLGNWEGDVLYQAAPRATVAKGSQPGHHVRAARVVTVTTSSGMERRCLSWVLINLSIEA
nr:putative integron gene cassette protein [uncultured bacterium]